MKICILKSTGAVLEMQSDATDGTLIKNAVSAGHSAADVEEREVTPAEYEALMAAARSPADALKQELDALDAANPITQRNLRELVIAIKTGADIAETQAYKTATAVETAAVPIRERR